MMTEPTDRFCLQGWGVSLAIHAVAVTCALALAAHVRPILKEDVFQWEVALVQSATPDASPAPAEASVASTQAKVDPVPASPPEPEQEPVVSRVAPQRSAQMVHPVVEPAKPTAQKLESAEETQSQDRTIAEPVEQKMNEPDIPKIQPVDPLIQAQPKVEPSAREALQQTQPEPVIHSEPLVTRSQPTPSAEVLSHERLHQPDTHMNDATSDQSQPEQSSQPAAHQHSSEVAKAAESSSESFQARSSANEPVQVAKALPPGREAKADHRWLAESLWRRVAELKRYPSSARLHGLEGKVVLKAIIRSDGHLAEVSVQKSSGHTVLDEAAIEAVKLACPLHMKQKLETPQIVVSLPIVYSLAN